MAAPATRVSVPRRRVMIRAEEESSGTQAPEPVRGPMGTPMRGLSFDMNERAGERPNCLPVSPTPGVPLRRTP